MTQGYDEKTILDYVEGELPADERASFEKSLQDDAKLSTLVKRLAEDRQALRGLPREQPPRSAPGSALGSIPGSAPGSALESVPGKTPAAAADGDNEMLIEAAQVRMERAMLLDDDPPLPLPRSAQSAERALFRIDHFLAWSAVAAMLILTASMMVMTLYDPTSLELAQLPSDAGLEHFADKSTPTIAQAEPTETTETTETPQASQAMAMGRATLDTPPPAQQSAPQGTTMGKAAMKEESLLPDDAASALTLDEPTSLGTPLAAAGELEDDIEIPGLLDDATATQADDIRQSESNEPALATLPPARLTLGQDVDPLEEMDQLLERLEVLPFGLGPEAAPDIDEMPLALEGAVVAPAMSVSPAPSSLYAAERTAAKPEHPEQIVLRVASADPSAAHAAVLAWAKTIERSEKEAEEMRRQAPATTDQTSANTQAERESTDPTGQSGLTVRGRRSAQSTADADKPGGEADGKGEATAIHLELTPDQLESLKAMLARTAGTSAVVVQASRPTEQEGREESQDQSNVEATTQTKRPVRIVITRQTQ